MSTPAGWHPQPDGTQRYWDGAKWTDHVAPGQHGAPPDGAAASAGTPSSGGRPWFKKKRFLIPGGVAALIILGSAMGAAGGEPNGAQVASDLATSAPSSTEEVTAEETATQTSKPAATTPAAPKQPALPKLGSKVRDGKFEFTVTGLKCGIKQVGSQYLNTKAQGEFCQLSLKITNIGDEPQTMFADNQEAFDVKGRKFSPDSEASIYDDNSQVLWEEINPGNTVKGKVFYDVPKGTKLVKVELHDSAFSGGVEVALKK
jgi:Domain of unknown function (DUF4352)/Protein of unknown function (DUF2510)